MLKANLFPLGDGFAFIVSLKHVNYYYLYQKRFVHQQVILQMSFLIKTNIYQLAVYVFSRQEQQFHKIDQVLFYNLPESAREVLQETPANMGLLKRVDLTT